MKKIKKVNKKSDDVFLDELEKFKNIFPQFVVEGEEEQEIDFDALKTFLDENQKIDDEKERYNFTWNGKQEAFKNISKPSFGTLVPKKQDSVDFDNTENIFIEGDNLEVLKLLQANYRRKIKMIYIDPPYNTGKDFVYKDNFKEGENEYYEKTGDKVDGIKTTTNADTNGRYHSAWLSMMYPRLFLAKQLLCDDGVIFISIDDNEQYHLRMLMNEIFGEENLLSTHNIQVRYASKSLNEKKDFQELLEYVLIYAKDYTKVEFNKPYDKYPIEKFNLDIAHDRKPTKTVEVNGRKVDIWLPNTFEIKKKEKGSIEFFKETWISGSILSGTGHGLMYTKVIDSRRKKDGDGCLYRIYGIGEDGLGYRYYTNPISENANRGKMYTKVPTILIEDIKEGKAKKEKPIINFYDFSPDFGNISHEGGISFNSGKKPIKMLKQFISYLKSNNDDLVLDFFAGSATTGHAVMDLNKKDNEKEKGSGNRKFILVQLPEKVDEKSEAFKAGYKNIAEISKDRLRKAIEKNDYKAGFKVFALEKSNYRIWKDYEGQDVKELKKQMQMFADSPLENNWDEEGLVYEILLKEGFSLNSKVRKEKDYWVIENKSENEEEAQKIFIDLSKKIDSKNVEKMQILKTDTFVCFDSALTDSQKVNFDKNFNLRVI